MGAVQLEREGRVAILTFDNPPRNMLTTGMFAELGRHVRALDADPDVRAVIIQGAGDRLYTVGADIREMDVVAAREQRAANTAEWLANIHESLDAIERSPKVYICAMKGHSYGGGLETAAACVGSISIPHTTSWTVAISISFRSACQRDIIATTIRAQRAQRLIPAAAHPSYRIVHAPLPSSFSYACHDAVGWQRPPTPKVALGALNGW